MATRTLHLRNRTVSIREKESSPSHERVSSDRQESLRGKQQRTRRKRRRRLPQENARNVEHETTDVSSLKRQRMQQKGIITGRREMSSMLTHHGLQQLTTDPYWQGRNTMDEDQEGLVMGVLSVHRYIADSLIQSIAADILLGHPTHDVPLSFIATAEDADGNSKNEIVPSKQHHPPDWDVYDLIITDGTQRLRCLAGAELHKMIQRGTVGDGRLIVVRKARIFRDEMSIGGRRAEIVLLECDSMNIAMENALLQTMSGLPWREEPSKPSHPAVGLRCTYFPLHDDDSFSDELPGWNAAGLPVWPVENQSLPEVASFASLYKAFKEDGASKMSVRSVYACGRVIGRTRIISFAKIKDSEKHIAMYPFFYKVFLDDGESVAPLLIWGKAVQKYHSAIRYGDVIMLTHFDVKLSKPEMGPRVMEVHFNMRSVKDEIFAFPSSLASLHPSQAQVAIKEGIQVRSASAPDSTEYGKELLETCQTLFDIHCSPRLESRAPEAVDDDDSVFGVQGLVVGTIVFCGRLERERQWSERQMRKHVPIPFAYHRWIILVDKRLDCFMPVQVRANSDLEGLKALSTGNVVGLTRLNYKSFNYASNLSRKRTYLYSSYETTLVPRSQLRQQLTKQATIPRDALKKIEASMNQTCFVDSLSSLFPFHPMMLSDQKYVSSIPVVPLNTVHRLESELVLYERRAVLVQARPVKMALRVQKGTGYLSLLIHLASINDSSVVDSSQTPIDPTSPSSSRSVFESSVLKCSCVDDTFNGTNGSLRLILNDEESDFMYHSWPEEMLRNTDISGSSSFLASMREFMSQLKVVGVFFFRITLYRTSAFRTVRVCSLPLVLPPVG